MIGSIALRANSPVKPALGAACNGCGVCCALEPCPPARLFLFQFRGHCRALLWTDDCRYACGLVLDPGRYLPWLPRRLRAAASRFFASRIAAGSGCDADLEWES